MLFSALNLRGEILYVGSATEGLVVLDRSGNDFSILSVVPLNGEIRSIRRNGNFLYVAAGTGGVYVLSLSDPRNPEVVAQYDTRGFAYDIAPYRNFVFVSDFEDGVKIFRLNGKELQKIATIKLIDMSMGIKVSFPYLFVSNGNNGVQIYNIKNPCSPKLIRGIDTPGIAWDIDSDGRFIYVALKDSGFAIYDFSKPPSAPLVSQTSIKGVVFKLKLKDKKLYLLITGSEVHEGNPETKGLLIYDVSNPAEPSMIGKFDRELIHDFFIENGKIYLALTSHGLGVLDVSNPAKPQLTSIFNIGNRAVDVWCNGSVAAVADNEGGAKIINVSNPSQAVITTYVPSRGKTLSVCGMGDLLFIPDTEKGVYVYNISNPRHPYLVSTIKKKGATRVVCEKGYLYVLYRGYGIKIYQMTPKPYWIAELLSGGKQIEDIAVGEGRLYLSEGWNGITLINITRMTRPEPTSHMASLYETTGIAAKGKYFYTARDQAGMMIGNAEDFYNTFEISHVNLNIHTAGIKVHKNYVLLAGKANGAYVIDVSDPEKPYVISHLKTPGEVQNIYMWQNRLCIADGWNGFIIADFTDREKPKILSDLLWFTPSAIVK